MAKSVELKKGNIRKRGFIGFSWTMLFFGAFVPLFRGDIAWFFISIITAVCTFGLSHLVMPFYNKIYTRNLLLKNDLEAADEESEKLLRKSGLLV